MNRHTTVSAYEAFCKFEEQRGGCFNEIHSDAENKKCTFLSISYLEKYLIISEYILNIFFKFDVETSLTFSQRQKSPACFKDAVVCWQLVVSILFFTKILKSTRKQTRSSKFLSFESRHVDDVCSCE